MDKDALINVNITLFSALDEEDWHAEIWLASGLWAVVSDVGTAELVVEFFVQPDGKPFVLPFDYAKELLERAKNKLATGKEVA